jgi:hypothetical protein
MEDEGRALPPGWVRQYDSQEHHQFFVDTTTDPPRSIWHHPYDDEQYMNSLSPQERQKIEGLNVPPHPGLDDESTDDEHHTSSHFAPLPPREGQATHAEPHKTLGRKIKDSLTGSTHEEREEKRRQRDLEEQRLYEQHQKFRLAMSKAEETGEPQFLGRDREGKEVFIEPSYSTAPPGGYGSGQYGYNPYTQGPYTNPNARFVRPQQPYSRPYGPGYGGGMGYGMGYGGMGYGMGGMGMGAPLMGLGGGMLIGSMLF